MILCVLPENVTAEIFPIGICLNAKSRRNPIDRGDQSYYPPFNSRSTSHHLNRKHHICQNRFLKSAILPVQVCRYGDFFQELLYFWGDTCAFLVDTCAFLGNTCAFLVDTCAFLVDTCAFFGGDICVFLGTSVLFLVDTCAFLGGHLYFFGDICAFFWIFLPKSLDFLVETGYINFSWSLRHSSVGRVGGC